MSEMSEEVEIFLEDCEDQLQAMEDALVEIENSGVNSDSVDAIFRTKIQLFTDYIPA